MRNAAFLIILALCVACADAPDNPAAAAAKAREGALRQRAEQGDPMAQLLLAENYRTGKGLPVDLGQAVVWYRKAARQGLPAAQQNLAVALEHGKGTDQNATEAAQWYTRAARQDLPTAQYSLARLLLFGTGIDRNPQAAARWFRRAARNGNIPAVHHLGLMNRDGLGMPRNRVEAGKWFLVAAKRGNLRAQADYHMLASQLTPEQRKIAESLAAKEQAVLDQPPPVPMDMLRPLDGRLVDLRTGKPHTGRAVRYHPNASPVREVDLVDGLPHGWETVWLPSGQPASRTQFEQGQRTGLVEEWYASGQLCLRGTNRADRLEVATSFGHAGNVTGQVQDGNGTLILHYPNGQRASEHVFEDGVPSAVRRWTAEGKQLD
tara:strand:- start:335 stop:1465 length:1131 start_codon:yes stop_codon:yes gene_type:complete